MGCDIHVVVERKCLDGKWRVVNPEPLPPGSDRLWTGRREWGCYAEGLTPMEQLEFQLQPVDTREPPRLEFWWFGRNYRAFAQLADVRSPGRDLNLWPLRGFPKDASALTTEAFGYFTETDGIRVFRRHDDWHSPNWILGSELADYRALASVQDRVDRIEELVSALKKVAEEHGATMEEVRAVFWFDN
jgi:hypothetical protein